MEEISDGLRDLFILKKDGDSGHRLKS